MSLHSNQSSAFIHSKKQKLLWLYNGEFFQYFQSVLSDTELSTDGGLQIVGWLEGPTGIVSTVRTKDNPKNLAFAVSLGSTYELVSAVYARGRMLVRLQNFTFQCPQDTKKQMKKYGQNVPLAAFISQSLFQKFSSDQSSTII